MAPEAEIYDYRVIGPKNIEGIISNNGAVREAVSWRRATPAVSTKVE